MKKIISYSLLFFGLICFLISGFAKSANCPKEGISFIKDSVIHEVTGVIVNKNKAVVKLKMDQTDSLPLKDQSGILSKYFENKIGNMNLTGWLTIADIKILSVAGNEIKVLVEKEQSVTYVNGEKKNHFKPGNKIKITWKTPE